MKTKLTLLILTIFIYTVSQAQTIDCNSFCVTNMEMDSNTPKTMNVTIYFSDTSSSPTFLAYPYVYCITNNNGDTVATGNMCFFGQIGNTSQTYSVNTIFSSLPGNFTGTVYFTSTEGDCSLPYPCTTVITEKNNSSNKIIVYPNPSNGIVTINIQNRKQGENYELFLFNILGEQVYSEVNFKQEENIDLSSYPKGTYFLRIKGENNTFNKKVIIE
jgi:hypothetical protein